MLVAILAATVVAALVAARTAVPASVGLVLMGLGVALIGPGVGAPVPPGLLLAIVLPGLVFEAAFRTDAAVLRPVAIPVIVLAIPGVVVVAAIVAAVLTVTTELTLTEGFLVGAIVAATDPAAVLATFRHAAVPARLAMLVEMESLVNDGTGIVLFALALDLIAGGGSLVATIGGFGLRVAGGAALGALLGWVAGRAVHLVDDHLAELTITVVLAYGTYLVAEALALSGVIATLLAAGTFGATSRGGLTARTVDAIDDVWEFAAFLLTAGVFLLVGLSIAPDRLVHAAGAIGWAILATLAARAVVVFGVLGAGSAGVERLGLLVRPRLGTPRRIPRPWLAVVFWAGLRGAVSVALALSLPATLAHRDVIQGLVYGVVLFTLIAQGTTAGWLVRRSGASASA